MSNSYTYNPDAWNPLVAGAVAGAIAAFVAGLVSLILRSPSEIVANSLSVIVGSLVLGTLAGGLWRRLRAGDSPEKVFAWSMAGGFLVLMLAVTAADQFLLSSLIPYAAPLAVIIFITLGFFVPVLSRVTA
ncbi:MAG: LytS/YhcK type 5TM receptor domain-containing protein, partial [Acidimicrobiia bacterium]